MHYFFDKVLYHVFSVFLVFLGVNLAVVTKLNKLLELIKLRRVHQGKIQENPRLVKYHKVL